MPEVNIHSKRISYLNDKPENNKGRYVLYWMQQSQRVHYNHALTFAIDKANTLGLPVLVLFGLMNNYPEANLRHYVFMLEGLDEVQEEMARKGIAFTVEQDAPVEVAVKHSAQAALVVCDRGYLRHQRQWRSQVAWSAPCSVVEVESDVVIPVQVVSNKTEYAARTIRPKINRALDDFLHPLTATRLKCQDPDLAEPADFAKLKSEISVDPAVGPVTAFLKGGRKAARKRLSHFITKILPDYDRLRNHPEMDGSTMLSPFLHFGQISALEIALAVRKADAPEASKSAFLEELIVRRELAFNFVFCHTHYDQYTGLPDWCRRTLETHRSDHRDPIYSEQNLIEAATHDPYWNAAMNEMKYTGFMHNYMRMYWGKKILQWTPDPKRAFEILLRLNNTYFVDGRDPNSYAGVGWIFGLHDRPWKERAIFGQVRYMARSGLERKFNMQEYVDKVKLRIERMNRKNNR